MDYSDYERKINKVLIKYWDPIGVKDEPISETEYENYVPKILRKMLDDDPSEDDLVDYLKKIEVEEMGINRDKDRIRKAASELQNILDDK